MPRDVVSGKPAVTEEQLALLIGEPARRHVARIHVDAEIAFVGGYLDALEGAELDDAARDLGERLHAHVRFEERVLFTLLERRLGDAQLAALGRALRGEAT